MHFNVLHGTLYVCGFLTITTSQCRESDTKKLLLGVGYVCIRELLLRPLIKGSENLFIYMLLDGIIHVEKETDNRYFQ